MDSDSKVINYMNLSALVYAQFNNDTKGHDIGYIIKTLSLISPNSPLSKKNLIPSVPGNILIPSLPLPVSAPLLFRTLTRVK